MAWNKENVEVGRSQSTCLCLGSGGRDDDEDISFEQTVDRLQRPPSRGGGGAMAPLLSSAWRLMRRRRGCVHLDLAVD